MIPGIFTWIFILTPLIAVFMGIPYILVGYITVIVVYWLYRAFLFVYGLWLGIKRTRRDVKVDWMDKIQNEYREEYEKLKYVLIYPVYNEGLETIEPSVAGWADSDVDTKKISFVVAIEEKTRPAMHRILRIHKTKIRAPFQGNHLLRPSCKYQGRSHGCKGR